MQSNSSTTYNFVVIGFGSTERPSGAIFSLAAYCGGLNLCFLRRARQLPDPTSILRGSGKVVRNVALSSAQDLASDDLQPLLDAALNLAAVSMAASLGPKLVIKSVSAKQRPRR